MALDFPTYSKIYNALVPKTKTFDRVKFAKTLVEFIQDTYSISTDRIKNPNFILGVDYFSECIRDREETINDLQKMIDELQDHIEKLQETCERCVEEEARLKEEETKKKLEKKKRKGEGWNTQKSTACGSDKDGTSKRGRRPQKTTKMEDKAPLSGTTHETNSQT